MTIARTHQIHMAIACVYVVSNPVLLHFQGKIARRVLMNCGVAP
jgi:hypothetical protein